MEFLREARHIQRSMEFAGSSSSTMRGELASPTRFELVLPP
jgi:hypothetical protein